MTAFVEYRWRAKDGLKLFARDYPGSSGALPVICIPGLTRNSRDFEELAPRIVDASGRRVLAVDLRGRGSSEFDVNVKNYAPATYASDVLGLMAELRVPKAVFIGTSLGGFVTITLAAKRISAIAAAVLNDIGPRVEKAGLERIASYVGKSPTIRTWADAARYARETNGAAFPEYGDDDWDRFARRIFNLGPDGAPAPSYDRNIFRPVSPLQAMLAGPLVWGAYRRLARHRPVLVIRGQTSDILSETTLRKMERGATAFSCASVPNVGHAPSLTEPASWEAIRTFLAAGP
jgi:pimeloyl-ACP methyl ester carboxylesterase